MRAITTGSISVAEKRPGDCAMQPLGARFQDVFGCSEAAPAPDRLMALMAALEEAVERGDLCSNALSLRGPAARR